MSSLISAKILRNMNMSQVWYHHYKPHVISECVSFCLSHFSTQTSAITPASQLAKICKSGNIPNKFNFATHVVDKHVKNWPSKTALWFDNGSQEKQFTYADFQTESIRAAVAIQNLLKSDDANSAVNASSDSDTSVKMAPLLFSLLPAIPEWWFLHLGCIRSANVFCPGTVQLSSLDVQYRLQVSRAKIIVTNAENMDKVDEAEERLLKSAKWAQNQPLKKILVGENAADTKNGWLNYNDLVGNVKQEEISQFKNAETNSQDISICYFTSGTTGNPKMVAHTCSSFGIGHYKTADLLQLRESDILWSPNDPGWVKGSYCPFYASLITGNTVYVRKMDKFLEPKKILEILREKPISVFYSIPTLTRALIQIEGKFETKALRVTAGGGEPVNPEIVRAWKEKTGLTMDVLYGQTETTTTGGPQPQKEASFGNPSGHYDLRIVSNEGQELKTGEEGNIAYKIKPTWPVGLFKGYLTEGANGPVWDTEKHKTCFVGDYYITGDQGYMDEDGNGFFVARADDVIISAASSFLNFRYRIGPFEVESALQTHPAVAESAVVGSPDPVRGEIVKAFVVLSEKYKNRKDLNKKILATELQEHVKSITAPYKYPRKIEFVDSLPKTVSGKILRRELRRQEFS